ncbi:MAG: hypothetical protein IBX64_09740 [Actinobacteria bacterium]|nr:hypothetical protein [Actinomycetota bacterium]
MAKTAILKGFFDRVGLSVTKKQDAWSVIKIEKMLQELRIDGYEFLYQPKVVRLKDKNQLMRLLLHMVPSEISSEYNLILGKFNDEMKLKVGSWQFEAKV